MTIVERLRAGERLVLDGGTGSELQRRGVDVLQQVTKQLKAWSAVANLTHADVVQQVHQDYLRVGADIITSNNFWTSPTRLATVGMQDRWPEYATAAVAIALRARDAAARERPEATVYVAGGIAPPALQDRDTGDLISDVERLGKDAFQEEMAAHARLLAQSGVDCIWCEYLGYVDECVAAFDAAAGTGLPVFIGIRHLNADGSMQYGESFADLVAALGARPVAGILLMCSNPEAVSAGLPLLRAAYGGVIGGYANLGYNPTGPVANRPTLSNQRPSSGPDVIQSADYYPSRIARFASDWLAAGAQIVGGCCASGPEHIRRDPARRFRGLSPAPGRSRCGEGVSRLYPTVAQAWQAWRYPSYRCML